MIFITEGMALRAHEDQIQRYGGEPGLRDRSLLLSALAMPQQTFGGEYLHRDLYEMAAAYVFHLVSNHAFTDGNKRIGAVLALVFLELNGLELTATEADYEALVLSVAQGQADKAAIAGFYRAHSRPRGASAVEG